MLNKRLAEIQDALLHLPCGASPERYSLLVERDNLRRAAASYRRDHDDGRSTRELEAELASLKKRRKDSVSQRTGFATSKGGGNHSPTPGVWLELGTRALAGGELANINARISQIEDVLAKRLGTRS